MDRGILRVAISSSISGSAAARPDSGAGFLHGHRIVVKSLASSSAIWMVTEYVPAAV